MYKFILAVLFMIMCSLPSYAINWVSLTSPSGSVIEVDTDSVIKYYGYYFYNIKFIEDGKKETIITMQASAAHPFCARINYYTPEEYVALNGDYASIHKKFTRSLEPVAFESRAYTAYQKVKSIMKSKDKPQITF